MQQGVAAKPYWRAKDDSGQMVAAGERLSSSESLVRDEGAPRRRTLNNWSIRWDAEMAADARRRGLWIDETVGDIAERKARLEPTALMVVDDARRMDAATLYAEARALAQAMIVRGLRPGDAVSFMLPNWHEATVIYLAATLAGLVVHPIVPDMPDKELAFMLSDIVSQMIFVPAQFRGMDYRAKLRRIAGELNEPPEVVVVRGEAEEFVSYLSLIESECQASLPRVDPDSVKLVLYTSGTTGRPKGVLHSHNSINALVAQLREHWRAEAGGRFFIPSPIGHIGGSIYAFEFPFLFGTTAVLQETWDADAAVDIVERECCTHMAGASSFLQQFLVAAQEQGRRLPHLSVIICGGTAVSPMLVREAQRYFTGCSVSRVFGSTEVPAATVGSMDPDDGERAAETDGRIGMTQVKLLDADGRQGERGEVFVRGPQMLVGYLWAIDEREAFDRDGFIRTGDFARLVDDEYLVVTGSQQDIIVRQNRRIEPKEIEDLLALHPDIAEAALIGLPDGHHGESLCAVIVPRPGTAPDAAMIRAYLEAQDVPEFKIPSQIEIRQAFPRNSIGKLLKNLIRTDILARAPKDAIN